MVRRLIAILCFFVALPVFAGDAPEIEDQTREIAKELRCVVCQNLSVADSPSEMAQQMRDIIREQLAMGKNPEEVKSFFVSKYGEWVLLSPATRGFSLLVWVLPFAVSLAGIALGIYFIRRWSAKKSLSEPARTDPAFLARVRSETAGNRTTGIDPEDPSERAQMLQERERLYTELKELEFDFQAGKLSEADYQTLRLGVESKAAAVLQQLEALPLAEPAPKRAPDRKPPREQKTPPLPNRAGFRTWQLVAGATFLLIFGLTLGVMLTNSLRPRGSAEDSITGDFLTGTGGSQTSRLLREGKSAFEKRDWPKAIESFKKVLAADPNQPEAHTYMGFILVQAGHADGALMAFDKALAITPDLAMALWGKGMTLYQSKQDSAAAKPVLQKLLQIMPAGEERGEVEKVLAEISQNETQTAQPAQTKSAATKSTDQISGTITIDSKLKAAADHQGTLFIIARPGRAGGGPPLAVKKIDRPVFPLSYSLGADNVMMQGRPFSGKVSLSVRLDKDGNAMTREAGNLSGDYKNNPVEVGSKNVDIVLDQIAQ
jgi:cytochrome c-type biogenesis protein CcmH